PLHLGFGFGECRGRVLAELCEIGTNVLVGGFLRLWRGLLVDIANGSGNPLQMLRGGGSIVGCGGRVDCLSLFRRCGIARNDLRRQRIDILLPRKRLLISLLILAEYLILLGRLYALVEIPDDVRLPDAGRNVVHIGHGVLRNSSACSRNWNSDWMTATPCPSLRFRCLRYIPSKANSRDSVAGVDRKCSRPALADCSGSWHCWRSSTRWRSRCCCICWQSGWPNRLRQAALRPVARRICNRGNCRTPTYRR